MLLLQKDVWRRTYIWFTINGSQRFVEFVGRISQKAPCLLLLMNEKSFAEMLSLRTTTDEQFIWFLARS